MSAEGQAQLRQIRPDLWAPARRILEIQTPAGAIPWFEAGPWDPWNHGECLMALSLMGERAAVEAGFAFLAEHQESDGGWLAQYGNTLPMQDRLRMARVDVPKIKDTNYTAYCATVLWHDFVLRRDHAFVACYWPMVRAAMEFVLTHQHAEGDISFSKDHWGTVRDDALVTGNASIFASLRCALRLAEVVGDPQPHWQAARERLAAALQYKPHRFDRTRDRSDSAMDWYYPVLTSALPRAQALQRLDAGTDRFLRDGVGCRCVSTQPWVTVAESAELAMTLLGLGADQRARNLLNWQGAIRDDDGAYWMGWHFEEDMPWPLEKPSWTQAAIILAWDAAMRASRAWDVICARD